MAAIFIVFQIISPIFKASDHYLFSWAADGLSALATSMADYAYALRWLRSCASSPLRHHASHTRGLQPQSLPHSAHGLYY